MSNKRKINKRKILVDLIVLTLGQKKKSFEKSWKWTGDGQEGVGSKRNSCEPMAT